MRELLSHCLHEGWRPAPEVLDLMAEDPLSALLLDRLGWRTAEPRQAPPEKAAESLDLAAPSAPDDEPRSFSQEA